MKLYLDTSALVKLYVTEDGSERVRSALDQADLVATAAIAYVEARSAFVRRRSEGGLSPAEYGKAVRSLDADWPRYLILDVSEPLIRQAARAVESHRLRAFDALHLAAAALFRVRMGEPLVFATWDGNLRKVAGKEGLAPLPD